MSAGGLFQGANAWLYFLIITNYLVARTGITFMLSLISELLASILAICLI